MRQSSLKRRSLTPRCADADCRERFEIAANPYERFCPKHRTRSLAPATHHVQPSTSPRRVVGRSSAPRGPGQPQPKASGRITLSAPTVLERIRWRRLREDVGCIACLREGLPPFGSHIEIHHLLSGSRRISHLHTISLHAIGCHREGTAERPARHPMQGGRVLFERYHRATEHEMLEDCNRRLEAAASPAS